MGVGFKPSMNKSSDYKHSTQRWNLKKFIQSRQLPKRNSNGGDFMNVFKKLSSDRPICEVCENMGNNDQSYFVLHDLLLQKSSPSTLVAKSENSFDQDSPSALIAHYMIMDLLSLLISLQLFLRFSILVIISHLILVSYLMLFLILVVRVFC